MRRGRTRLAVRRGRAIVIVAGLASLGLLNGCGGTARAGFHQAPNFVVAHVGGDAITDATLMHWMAVMAPGHAVPQPPSYAACVARLKASRPSQSATTLRSECGDRARALRQRTLSYLISAHWLLSEAAAEGLPVTKQEIQQRLASKSASLLGSAGGLQVLLRTTGQTLSDAELEAAAEVARETLMRRVTAKRAQPTGAEVAAYYHLHLGQYQKPERRYFRFMMTKAGAATARRYKYELRHGRRWQFGGRHELLARSEVIHYKHGELNVLATIFKAKPHLLLGPIVQDGHYFVYEVVRIYPAHQRSLASARGSVIGQLVAISRRRALQGFIAAWRRRWTRITDCAPSFVVANCSQFHGAMAAEDELWLR